MTDFLNAARLATQSGQIEQAVQLCGSAIAADAGNGAAYQLRGLIALNKEELQSAKADFDAALRIEPGNPHYLTSAGFLARKLDDSQYAEDCFRRAIASDANTVIARYQLGTVLLERFLQSPVQINAPEFKKISVIVPSRLDKHPKTGQYWLDRAIRSVLEQTVAKDTDIEIIVGIDPGSDIPPYLQKIKQVSFAEAAPRVRPGQAAAINAAMAKATGDVVTLLEDDDCWHPKRLEYGMQFLAGYDFVSCNQLEIDPDNRPQTINDFPTPCGWLMRRELWDAVGEMDEDHMYHLDTEWLGRLNAHLNQSGGKRCHIVESGVPVPFDQIVQQRPQLPTLIRWMPVGSGLFRAPEPAPLILRTVHPNSGMAKIASDAKANAQSVKEHEMMLAKFGYYPW